MKEAEAKWNFEDIHDTQTTLKSCRKTFLETEIREEDKKLIVEFIEERTRRKSLSVGRPSSLAPASMFKAE